jgi:hypothetical protein
MIVSANGKDEAGVLGDITPIARPPEIDTAESRDQLLEEDLRTSSATSRPRRSRRPRRSLLQDLRDSVIFVPFVVTDY